MTQTKEVVVPMPFQSIGDEMVNRLAAEADVRTLRPQEVDWKEIHRQAALARKAG